nr:MAG TPA: hypothetical protein [Caudoviricetes sp.]
MEEKLIGQAKRSLLGNDLFWEFLKYDEAMPDHFIDLQWTGYNDQAWWTKWSRGTEVKEQGGRKFRIDYANCNVYELVGVDCG